MVHARVGGSRQLGAVVRTARERTGLSQTALAQHADLERQWLVLLENGKLENPKLSNVLKVLDALGLELAVQDSVHETSLDQLMGRS